MGKAHSRCHQSHNIPCTSFPILICTFDGLNTPDDWFKWLCQVCIVMPSYIGTCGACRIPVKTGSDGRSPMQTSSPAKWGSLEVWPFRSRLTAYAGFLNRSLLIENAPSLAEGCLNQSILCVVVVTTSASNNQLANHSLAYETACTSTYKFNRVEILIKPPLCVRKSLGLTDLSHHVAVFAASCSAGRVRLGCKCRGL